MKSQQDNYKTILNDYNKEKIRNKMINYYDVNLNYLIFKIFETKEKKNLIFTNFLI